jgi:hypothetical protein
MQTDDYGAPRARWIPPTAARAAVRATATNLAIHERGNR